jgi:hypothetical protein
VCGGTQKRYYSQTFAKCHRLCEWKKKSFVKRLANERILPISLKLALLECPQNQVEYFAILLQASEDC